MTLVLQWSCRYMCSCSRRILFTAHIPHLTMPSSRSFATASRAAHRWWEVARVATVDPELHKSLGVATMRILLADEERFGCSPAMYRGKAWTDTLHIRPVHQAYATLKPPAIGREAQTLNDSTLWGKVTKVTAFSVDVKYQSEGRFGGSSLALSPESMERDVPIEDVTTGAPVGRMAVGGSIEMLRKAFERCWPAHLDTSPKFLVSGHTVAPGEYTASDIFARAPIQPTREALPVGLAPGFVLSAFEVEIGDERTPVYVHPDDATHLQAPSRPTGTDNDFFNKIVLVFGIGALVFGTVGGALKKIVEKEERRQQSGGKQ